MMHTEDEAKKLWCPMVRHAVEDLPGTNRAGTSNPTKVTDWNGCIASGCAMWRWAEPEKRKCPKCGGIGPLNCTTCFGTGRTTRDDRRGYCGLAGNP